MNINISEIDCRRFGLKIGRAEGVTEPSQVGKIKEFIKANSLDCLIVRCSSRSVEIIHRLEKEGFCLMEGRIRFVYQNIDVASDFPIEVEKNVKIRACADNDSLEPLIRSSYAGYEGHYHRNPLFKTKDCDDTYVDWALRFSADKSTDNYFSVIEKSGKIVGFASGGVTADGSFIGGLLGVDPQERNQGFAAALHHHRLLWCKEKGIKSAIVPTSLNNWQYQNLLIKLGYKILDSDLTFHWMASSN